MKSVTAMADSQMPLIELMVSYLSLTILQLHLHFACFNLVGADITVLCSKHYCGIFAVIS
jgi:hypothetical protein